MAKKKSSKLRQRAAEERKQEEQVLSRRKGAATQDEAQNPFELQQQRRKHDVLGQKVKGERGNKARARDAAIKSREKSLLVEYRQRHKDSRFTDKRFGEYNTGMSVEEKMLARFAAEQRKKHSRSSVFNLDDDDEDAEELLLTHNNRPLSEAMDSYIPSDEEMDEDAQDFGARATNADMVSRFHFGGGDAGDEEEQDDGQPQRKRTHREIMAEVIAKSKSYKHERQRQQQETEDMTNAVDDQLNDILGLVFGESNRAEQEGRVLAAPADSTYDTAIVQLAADNKARATDRLKTPQEEAEEARERLERLEAQRQARLRGEDPEAEQSSNLKSSSEYVGAGDDSDAEEDGAGLELLPMGDGTAKLVSKSGQAVDLNSSAKPGSGVADDDDEEASDDEDDEEAELDDSDAADASEDEFGLEPDFGASTSGAPEHESDAEEDFEVPFVFKPVSSAEDMMTLLEAYPISKRRILLERLIACHNVHLAAANRAIQETHFMALWQCVGQSIQQGEALSALEPLIWSLYTLMLQVKAAAATTARNRIFELHEKTRGGSWPSFPKLRHLIYFQIVPELFPASDRWHAVATPALLAAMHLLTNCNVANMRNMAAGLYLCSCAYVYVQESHRIVPEALAFLNSFLQCCTAAPSEAGSRLLLPAFSLLKPAQRKSLRCTPASWKGLKPAAMPLERLEAGFKGCALEQVKLDLVALALQLTHKFARLYQTHAAMPESLACAQAAARQLEQVPCLKAICTPLVELFDACAGMRDAVRFQAHKPVPLEMLEPDYNAHGFGKRSDQDQTDRENERLRRELRKERKGAVRELRKDARFLSKVKLNDIIENDRDRNQRLKSAFATLQSDQADFNKRDAQKR
ncbi:uncharacterized protein MONBRDRAFT_35747 [Monosiga brevicollis MX1]|uniref:Nucleolar protein 14 n=1 Tax=Monosiga brevicollis TaxID=81824 RepID=A9UNK1_MONBE|nr:uncharacterized protein MONBRDRAFT_35747 [Monosiga brevicollis MX1]EDQ92709.1 predicted protein [Monosiga brevicollis MX1]|eukprot:XP_001742471.1 hypothetical protein [Monosiga brevicollis MX1]